MKITLSVSNVNYEFFLSPLTSWSSVTPIRVECHQALSPGMLINVHNGGPGLVPSLRKALLMILEGFNQVLLSLGQGIGHRELLWLRVRITLEDVSWAGLDSSSLQVFPDPSLKRLDA